MTRITALLLFLVLFQFPTAPAQADQCSGYFESAHYHIGRYTYYFDQGDYQNAAQELRDASDEFERASWACEGEAAAEAQRMYEKSRKDSENLENSIRAYDYFEQGQAQFDRADWSFDHDEFAMCEKEYREAARLYQLAIDTRPEEWDTARNNKGSALHNANLCRELAEMQADADIRESEPDVDNGGDAQDAEQGQEPQETSDQSSNWDEQLAEAQHLYEQAMAHFNQGELYHDQQEYELCLSELSQANAIFNNAANLVWSEVIMRHWLTSLHLQEECKEALEAQNKAQTDAVPPRQEADEHFDRGLQYHRQQDYELCEREFTKAGEIYAQDGDPGPSPYSGLLSSEMRVMSEFNKLACASQLAGRDNLMLPFPADQGEQVAPPTDCLGSFKRAMALDRECHVAGGCPPAVSAYYRAATLCPPSTAQQALDQLLIHLEEAPTVGVPGSMAGIWIIDEYSIPDDNTYRGWLAVHKSPDGMAYQGTLVLVYEGGETHALQGAEFELLENGRWKIQGRNPLRMPDSALYQYAPDTYVCEQGDPGHLRCLMSSQDGLVHDIPVNMYQAK